MKTVEIKLYQVADLELPENEAIKAKVLEEQRNINVDYDWWDYTYEDFKRVAECMGINVDKPQFSGFYSQGDGASFTGRYQYKKGSVQDIKEYAPQETELHDIALQLQELQKKRLYKFTCQIKQSGRCVHENTMSVWPDRLRILDHKMGYEFLKVFRDLAKWLYKQLEKEHEYRTSDESVMETLKCNEYVFTEDGKIY